MSRSPNVPYESLLSLAREALQTDPQITTRQFHVFAGGGSLTRTGDVLRAGKVEIGLALPQEAATLPAALRALMRTPEVASEDVSDIEAQLRPVRDHLELVLRTIESAVTEAHDRFKSAEKAAEVRLGQELTDAQEHVATIREHVAELERELAEARGEAAEAREAAAHREHELAARVATLDAIMLSEKSARTALAAEHTLLIDELKSLQTSLASMNSDSIRMQTQLEACAREVISATASAERACAQEREARGEARAANTEAREAAAVAAAAEERARQQAAAAEERARAVDAAHDREIGGLREQVIRLETTVATLREGRVEERDGSGNHGQRGT